MIADQLLRRIAPDQRLLLRAVLGTGDGAQVAFQEWRERVIIEDLPAESHRLLPLLARRMDDLAPNDPVRALIRGTYRNAWVKNQLITRDAGAIAAALQSEGIPVLVLKGAALVGYYGNDWGTRPMYDVDLLVPTDQVDGAFRVLSAEGWRPRGDISVEWLTSRLVLRRHSWPFSRGVDNELDLHWHVLGGSLGRHADDTFWEDRTTVELGGVTVGALNPSDLLLHLIAHGARSASRSNLQWVADAVHVLRASDPVELAEPLLANARRHGLLATVRAALETIDVVVGEPAVQPLVRRLSTARRPLLERVATSGGGGSRKASARTVAALLSRHGGGGEGIVARSSAVARERLDLDHVHHPAAYLAYVASGRRSRLATLARRAGPIVALTSRSPDGAHPTKTDLDFTAAATVDRHAGPGWWKLNDLGLWSHGGEGRIVVDVQDYGRVDLDLDIVASSSHQRTHVIEVRVNERVVASVTIGPDEPTDVRLRVPVAIGRRFQPMEIAFLAKSDGLLKRRGPVGIRLQRLRITPSAMSPVPVPPESPPGSTRDQD